MKNLVRSLSRIAASVAIALAIGVSPAFAQEDQPEGCPALIAGLHPLFIPASLAADEASLTFVGHATFVIETPAGIRIATDYNDHLRPPAVPHIATMNKAHSTHFSHAPDPGITHVLRGWNPLGGPVSHDLSHGDVRIRNVSTNIRRWDGGTEEGANSIFVFETAELCIAHLGHLHHTLGPASLKALGRIDVLLVPVDGGYTLDTPGMIEVVRAINAPMMIPMHFFNPATLERFLAQVSAFFPIEMRDSANIVLSRRALPATPTVVVLPGR